MLSSDATYRLNWMNYPVFAVGMLECEDFISTTNYFPGAVSPTGKFRLGLIAVSSHEDWISQVAIFRYLKSLDIKPKFFMGKNENIFIFLFFCI